MINGILGIVLFISSLIWVAYFDHLRNHIRHKGKSTFALLVIGTFGFIVLFLAGGIIAVNWLHLVLLNKYHPR